MKEGWEIGDVHKIIKYSTSTPKNLPFYGPEPPPSPKTLVPKNPHVRCGSKKTGRLVQKQLIFLFHFSLLFWYPLSFGPDPGTVHFLPWAGPTWCHPILDAGNVVHAFHEKCTTETHKDLRFDIDPNDSHKQPKRKSYERCNSC